MQRRTTALANFLDRLVSCLVRAEQDETESANTNMGLRFFDRTCNLTNSLRAFPANTGFVVRRSALYPSESDICQPEMAAWCEKKEHSRRCSEHTLSFCKHRATYRRNASPQKIEKAFHDIKCHTARIQTRETTPTYVKKTTSLLLCSVLAK